MKEIIFEQYSMECISTLCGIDDEHLKILREYFDCDLVFRNSKLQIFSDDNIAKQIESVIQKMLQMIKLQNEINQRDVLYLCKLASINELERFVVESPKMVGKQFMVN